MGLRIVQGGLFKIHIIQKFLNNLRRHIMKITFTPTKNYFIIMKIIRL